MVTLLWIGGAPDAAAPPAGCKAAVRGRVAGDGGGAHWCR